MRKCEDQLYKTLGSLKDLVGENLEDKMSYGDASRLGLSNFADEVLIEYLKVALEDPKTKAKLAKQISTKVLQQAKQEDQERKAFRAKNTKLWNVTKGKIPCICGCGYTQQQTKEETLESSNKYICKDCSIKIEQEGTSLWTFFDKNIYEICGAE